MTIKINKSVKIDVDNENIRCRSGQEKQKTAATNKTQSGQFNGSLAHL